MARLTIFIRFAPPHCCNRCMKCLYCSLPALYAITARQFNPATARLESIESYVTCRDHLDEAWDALGDKHKPAGARLFVERVAPSDSP